MWLSVRKRSAPAASRAQTKIVTIPAPIGGWDERSPHSDMPPENAIRLDNFIPTSQGVETRPGYIVHATGLPGAVETLMDHSAINGTIKLFAASSTAIYEVTSAGAVGAAAVSSLTNARFEHTMFATPGGNFLVIANGADSVRNYSGSAWTTPSITGATSSTFATVTAHQGRLWFCIKDTSKVAYLDVASISGAATVLDLGSLMRRGGYLVNMYSWTRDGGSGSDDLAVFVTSRGEVLVYNGTDPSSSTTWALEGVFQIPEPIGRRCGVKAGSDLAILTVNGVLPLSQVLPSGASATRDAAATAWIAPAFTDAARAYSTIFGWEMCEVPSEQLLIVNVPRVANTETEQYVMDTARQRWCRFKNIMANCWRNVGQTAYFGGNTKVYKFGQAENDDGAAIRASFLTAFHTFGDAALKRFTRAKALVTTARGADIPLKVRLDYTTTQAQISATSVIAGGQVWGSAWGSPWGPVIEPQSRWRGIEGMGRVAAVEIALATKSRVRVNQIDVAFERGGFL